MSSLQTPIVRVQTVWCHKSPEPVMDQVVANELPNTQMEACGVGHISLLPLQLWYILIHSWVSYSGRKAVWDLFHWMQEFLPMLSRCIINLSLMNNDKINPALYSCTLCCTVVPGTRLACLLITVSPVYMSTIWSCIQWQRCSQQIRSHLALMKSSIARVYTAVTKNQYTPIATSSELSCQPWCFIQFYSIKLRQMSTWTGHQ